MISVEVQKSTIFCPVYDFLAQEAGGELAELNGNYILKRDQGTKPDLGCIDG